MTDPPPPKCTAAMLAAAADRCAAAQLSCAEVGAGAFGSYVVHWHCALHESAISVVPLSIWFSMVMLALCSTADIFLIPQLNYISELLRLKPDVAGVTLLAFGNGAADVFTGIAVATAHPEELDFSLMLSYQVGATIFIMTVVVGVVIFVAAKHSPGWKLSRMPFFRDSLCFLVAITAVLIVSAEGTIYTWEALLLLLLYFFYVGIVILLRYYIQPHWPDDTFGVYMSGKAAPALRAFRKHTSRLGSTPLARRAKVAARPLTRRLRPASEFLTTAGQGLLGALAPPPGGAPPAGAVATSSTAATNGPSCMASTDGLAPLTLQPLPSAAPLQSALEIEATPIDLTSPSAALADGGVVVVTATLDAQAGGGGGEGGGAGLLTEEGEGGGKLEGIDKPEGGSLAARVMWALELPLAWLRWLTIPSDGEWDGRRRKFLVATPTVASMLMLLEVSGGVSDAWESKAGSMPMLLLLPLTTWPLGYLLHRYTRDDVPPKGLTAMVLLGFMMTIVWLDLLATEVVALIEAAGFLLGISTSILGLTVIAIGNSSGDLVANVAAAKGSSAKMALASCFGSPLLMNLIGAGAALSLRMAVTGGKPIASSISQICRIAYLFLYLSIGCHLLAFPLGGYSASRAYAYLLFAMYGAFIVLALMAEGGALGDFMCPEGGCPK